MADEKLPPNPIFAAVFALHTLLGILGQAAVLAATSGVIHEGPWRVFVGGLGAILNVGAITLGVKYQGPRERAIMEEHSPTPRSAGGAGALLPLLFLGAALGLFLPACTPAQRAAWRTTGIDALKCLQPSVVDAAGDALVTLLGRLDPGASSSFDYASLGKALAQKYGTEAALCAVGKAWANLAPTIGMTPDRRAVALGWLVSHQSEWATP